jgi:septal ring factor EnvC (AmiA/AmiB activator)
MQLLLDPALNKEFNRLKTELESTHKELKHVQQELAATNFTQESKIGRQLMAKCRALADENEEMGRELSEGNKGNTGFQVHR